MDEGEPWMFTGFYGHIDPSKQHEAWALLSHLRAGISVPWVCLGTSMKYYIPLKNVVGMDGLLVKWKLLLVVIYQALVIEGPNLHRVIFGKVQILLKNVLTGV
jgi:hypothetical protein